MHTTETPRNVDPNVRHWDPKSRYIDSFIKCYDHWCLEVSYMQHTLGCFVLFSRHHVEKLSELPSGALKELAVVNSEIEAALTHSTKFRPDRFNYLQLGNFLHHLHVHGIPRYSSPRNAYDREWIDQTFGSPPIWQCDNVESELVVSIKDDIIDQFILLGYLNG